MVGRYSLSFSEYFPLWFKFLKIMVPFIILFLDFCFQISSSSFKFVISYKHRNEAIIVFLENIIILR
jgi:hypothetical protein